MPQRKRARLPDYDYATPGTYFVTINAHQPDPWFGTIRDGVLQPNGAGQMVVVVWESLPERFPGIMAGEVVVMPDHLHGIIMLGTDPEISAKHDLSRIIQAFKSITTVEYGRGVRVSGWRPFNGHLWHRGFHDIIVDSARAYASLQDYISANPGRWSERYEGA